METFHLYTSPNPLSPNNLPMPFDAEMGERLKRAKDAKDWREFSCLMLTKYAPRDDLDDIVQGTFHETRQPIYSYSDPVDSPFISRKLELISVKGACQVTDKSYVLFQRVDFAVVKGDIRFKNNQRVFIVELFRFKEMASHSLSLRLYGLMIPFIGALSWLPLSASGDASSEGKGHLVPDANYFAAFNRTRSIVTELLAAYQKDPTLFTEDTGAGEEGLLDRAVSVITSLNCDGVARGSFVRHIDFAEEKSGK